MSAIEVVRPPQVSRSPHLTNTVKDDTVPLNQVSRGCAQVTGSSAEHERKLAQLLSDASKDVGCLQVTSGQLLTTALKAALNATATGNKFVTLLVDAGGYSADWLQLQFYAVPGLKASAVLNVEQLGDDKFDARWPSTKELLDMGVHLMLLAESSAPGLNYENTLFADASGGEMAMYARRHFARVGGVDAATGKCVLSPDEMDADEAPLTNWKKLFVMQQQQQQQAQGGGDLNSLWNEYWKCEHLVDSAPNLIVVTASGASDEFSGAGQLAALMNKNGVLLADNSDTLLCALPFAGENAQALASLAEQCGAEVARRVTRWKGFGLPYNTQVAVCADDDCTDYSAAYAYSYIKGHDSCARHKPCGWFTFESQQFGASDVDMRFFGDSNELYGGKAKTLQMVNPMPSQNRDFVKDVELKLYKENSQSKYMCTLTHDWKKGQSPCSNDDARSILICNLNKGGQVRVCDHPDCSGDDKAFFTSRVGMRGCVYFDSFQVTRTKTSTSSSSFYDVYEQYEKVNGLDGKVSNIKIIR